MSMSNNFFHGKRDLLVFGAAGAISALAGTYFAIQRRKLLQSTKLSLYLPPKICVISTSDDWNRVSEEFLALCNERKVVGLDCEWVTKGSNRRPISMLQLATAQDICLLIRLRMLGDKIPPDLICFLQDKRILKVGVAIHDDAKKLFLDYGLIVRGCLDLRNIVDTLPGFTHLESKGLQQLVKVTMGYDMDKSYSIRCSDWEIEELTPRQIKYATEDAVSAALVFKYLVTSKELHWWNLTLPTDEELYLSAINLCYNKFDCGYSQKAKGRSPSKKLSLSSVSINSQSTKAYSTRSTPLYHNSQLQAPDGEPLCTCDVKKAQWYLDKGIGTIVSEDPLIVRLKFEPAGRPILDNKYYIKEKENRCVVCGETENVLRKIIVPHEYRKYFPTLMKEHLSHDVLLLCVNCHIRSNSYDSVIRGQLAEECDAPIGCQEDVKCREDPRLKKVKSAGRALLKSRYKLPVDRVLELESVIREYYNVKENEALTDEVIEKASNTEAVLRNNDYVPHGKKVVQVQSNKTGLMAFEKRWRKHFLETMKPRFLPEMWSINHNHERLVLQVTSQQRTDFDPSILGDII